ncbi:MAG: hypothetical protein HY974_00185 [Candidatus Kerfeldbacteria bacterium]|nr:hypothetical protein [Candidatus Kerfeldbacteria bacterium]
MPSYSSSVIHYSPPSGVVLLLSLLVLATMLTTSLTVGALVVRELKTTGTSDRGLIAYYAAESGLEQGLYLLRQERPAHADIITTLDKPYASKVTLLDGSLLNKAYWWRSSLLSEAQLNLTLKANEVVQLDLFDPTASLSNTASVNGLEFNWDAPSGGAEWLEVSWSGWKNTNPPTLGVGRQLFSSSTVKPVTMALDTVNYTNFRVRLRALFADVPGLVVKARNSVGYVDLPARITITAVGELSDARQALAVIVPEFAPQASAFDFTIFSECPIVKGAVDPPETETCP